ncbi:putative F-box/LRR-repeat protein At3g58880 [Papaver somniferum]|uniref:putative F-box/LRR-repeat protein At3g58880 n=1 Tax=Papaver somniferum TaxID=3469 RepID=UPI000E70166A|nr:putative F-box/LRR-repeat protein At3g58880 [Papaver somniferum]
MLRNCSTLHLEFSNLVRPCLYPTYHGMYTLPPCKTFPQQSLTLLKLTNCKLTISKRNILLSVKIAKLTVVDLRKDSLYNLVSRCPCLEELHLIRCKLSSSSFKLYSPKSNLKCLVLQYCICSAPPSHVGTLRHVAVNIPSLLQFKCEGISCYPTINNANNLTEAKIRILNTRENEHELLCKLLQDLHNVEVLTLCYQNLEVLGANGRRSLLTPLCNLKRLAITLLWVEKDLPNLMCLLRNSPSLEALSLDLHRIYEGAEGMISSVYNEDESTVLEPLLLPSDCVMHLTKIEIKNFQGLKVEMEFVKIMLQSSLCLKEMVICISSRYELLKQRIGEEHNGVLQMKKDAAVENILACTCASPDAQILIY